ncbi:RING finger protein 17 [Trichonephila clavata]|uniref:RING finger protein 17 n=1 Tax=Trichonephila clavata TaxID=2740835 RepID=A0A8X6GZG5_TRICU|nr:RING finger protein 17 [Trichonephila clavata]
MLPSLKLFQCPRCNSSYSTKDSSRFHSVTKFPRILTCGHTICESCLLSEEKKSKSFPCPTCKEIINLNADDLPAKFLPDVYALGIVCANLKNPVPSVKVKMVPSCELKMQQNEESLKKLAFILVCGSCKKHQALWQCDECELNYCSLCFKEHHNDTDTEKHEGKKIFAEIYNSMVQEGCAVHESKAVEFYCEVDEELTCSYCMLMGNHVGHQVKTLVDKNKSCADDLKSSLENVSHMQKQLKYTDHLLCEIIPKEKVDISNTIKEVHDYFHKLHTSLQTRESELLQELQEISEKSTNSLEQMRFRVTNYERDLASIKKDAESVIENPHLAISAPALLKKIEECKDLPCHLVPILDGAEKTFNLDLNLDHEFEKNIKQLGQIHFNVKSRFALLPSSDIPENFCTEIPKSFDDKLQETLDTESCHSDSVETFSEDSLSMNSEKNQHSNVHTSFKYRDYAKMHPERVLVSHVINPSCFYVQRCSELRKLKTLSDAINKWCNSYESKKDKVVTLEPGNLYLVRYDKDRKWYRGRVKSIIEPKDDMIDNQASGMQLHVKTKDGKIASKDKELKAVVYFIDYGNISVISLPSFINILPRFLNLPGIAKECSLVDIEPPNKVKWSSECLSAFSQFVDKKRVVMQIFEERNNAYLVDLCQSPDSEISNDVPVSVRDALVFLEHAIFPTGKKPIRTRNRNDRNYMPPEPLRMNSNISAIVTHMSTASYLANLIFEMNETYETNNTLLHSIYAPHIGMICAARYSLDKQWYRAKVIGLPGGAKVKVQYVDFGNCEIIHHKYLRKLFDKFFKLNIQAISCKLAQVTYGDALGWNKKATEWLTNQVSRKQLTLKSLGMIPGENKTEVVLYYNENDSEICINALLVEEGLAKSTGPFSDVSAVRKRRDNFVHKNNSKPLASATSLSGVNSAMNYPELFNDIDIPVLQEDVENLQMDMSLNDAITEKEKCPRKDAASNKKYPSLATSLDSSNHPEVHVSHVISPGSFYIRMAGDEEKKLKLLMNDLQKAYENVEEELVDCSEGKAYAAFCTSKHMWLRGTVLEKLADNKVKIHYVDYGNTEILEMKHLRKLLAKFSEDKSFSVLCHLDGIIPAGDSSKWSHSACDYFLQLVAPHELLLFSSKGDIDEETKSLPSDLLIEKLIRGGALEPTQIEFVSLTDLILKKGYALPSRKRCTNQSSVKVTLDIPVNQATLISNSETEQKSSNNEVISLEQIPIETNEIVPLEELPSVTNEVVPFEKTELPPEKPTFQWKPAVPPLEETFKGFVTNVGEDGSIHLYVLQNGKSQVETITKALQFKYNKSKHTLLKKAPPIGEACIAKFSVDKAWYRGEIINVYSEKVKVNFVDYGNNEIVPLSEIRTDLIMRDFPRQCLECALFGFNITATSKWDEDLLIFLHTQLVEAEVTVEVKAPPDAYGRLQCVITTASGINVAELLLSMGFTDLSENSDQNIPNEVPDTFAKALEIREGDTYPICISQISSKNVVYIQVLKILNPKDEYEEKLNNNVEAFLQLIATLQEKAEHFPKLKNPLPGKPCCAKYSFDDNWYRCEVTDLTENGAVVLYVDYGNSEIVSLNDLKEIEHQFIDFPVQIRFCELHDLKNIGDVLSSRVEEILKSLMKSNQDIFAKVVVSGEISQIDLLLKSEDGSYKSPFEDLMRKETL